MLLKSSASSDSQVMQDQIERREIICTEAGITRKCVFIGILLLCLFKVHWSFADETFSKERLLGDEEVPWEITAKSLSYQEKEETWVAKGDVVIKKANQTLYAQEAICDKKTGIVRASGDVRLEAAEDVLKCDRGIFNLKNQTGKIFNGLLFLKQNHYYVSGDVIEKIAKDTYLVKNCHLTTCDGPTPAWSITGSEVKVTMEGYGKVKHAAFRIRELPIFYVPYLLFPAKSKRQTGLLPPRVGYSDLNGVGAEFPFFWAISDNTDATFYERYMSERGYMQGLEFRYITNQNSKGAFLLDILSDRIEEKDLSDPAQAELSPFPRTNSTRYWLRGRMDQDLPYDSVARLDVDFVSDQDHLREFEKELSGLEVRPDLIEESGRPLEERFSPTRRSALRLSHDGESYSLQALAAYHQLPENRADDKTPQPIGGLDFTLLPQLLPQVPFYFKFDTDYEYIWRDVGTKGHSISFTPELSYPAWLGRHLEFDASVSYTGNAEWFDDPLDNTSLRTKDAYQAQARLSTILERVFGVEWRNVKKLKHKVTPSLTYDYRIRPEEQDESPWFEPIDLGADVNRIVFSIENLFDARMEDEKGVATYRQLATFNLSQGYNIDEARRDEEPGRNKKPFEPLLATMTLRPFPDLYFTGRSAWDHDKDKLTTVDLSLDLSVPRSGSRKDRYFIDYVDLEDRNKALRFWADVNLAYGFSAGTSLNRDLDLHQNIHCSYWLEYQSRCWAVRLDVGKEDEETSVMITLRLLGFNW